MKDYLFKILAVTLPLILAFSIQECSFRNAPEETTEEESEVKTSEIIVYHPDDPNNPANQTTEEDQDQTTPDNTNDPSPNDEIELPSDNAGIINLFNSAMDKTQNIKRTSYTRKLTLCKISFPIGDKTNDPKVQQLSAMDDKTPKDSDLVKLNEGMVSNATARKDGNNIILEINLKDLSKDKNVKSGDGGFVGIVEFEETKSLVSSIAKEALGLSVELKDNPSYKFSSGKYIITIDDATGKLKNVKHSYTEGGNGKVSVASVDLAIDITAEYTA